jgi:hypothetical protein
MKQKKTHANYLPLAFSSIESKRNCADVESACLSLKKIKQKCKINLEKLIEAF